MKLNSFEFDIIAFSEPSHPGVFLLEVNHNSSDKPETVYEGCYEIKNTLSSHGFQFLMLDIIIGCAVQFVNYILLTR
jgi:hypothetical protein